MTAIKDYAIYAVPALKELYLPETLTTLSTGAIRTCGDSGSGKLKSIYFAGGEPSKSGNSSIYGNASDLLLFRLKDAQWNDAAWTSYEFAEWDPNENFVDRGEIEPSEDFDGFTWTYERFNGRLTLEGTAFIPDYYNSDSDLPPWNEYIGEIQTIEAQVEQVGDYAFYQADRLRRLATESRPTTTGSHAFANCEKLVYITLANNAAIGEYSFAGNTCLKKSLDLTYATSIGTHAFENCNSIPSINLRYSPIEALGESAFAGCNKMSSITLPNSGSSKLLTLENNVFKDCASLTSVVLPTTVTSIGLGAFQGCAKLSAIDIPSKVTAIEDDTFNGCAAMKDVIFYTDAVSTGITSIGKNAFNGCSSLRTISIPA